MKLIGELVARPAHSASVGAAALNHELRDDAVKNQSVIERPLFLLSGFLVGEFLRAFRKPDKIGYRLGRLFLQQPHHDVSLRGFKNGVGSCRSAHAFSLYVARADSSYTSRSTGRHSPALLFPQFRDVGGVMFSMPFVQEKQPVDIAL